MTGMIRQQLLFVALLSLGACSWLPSMPFTEQASEPAAPTLADLEPALMPDKNLVLPNVDLDTLVATYREVLEVTDDPEMRLQVMHRLAGLEMKRGEQQLYEEKNVGREFDVAIMAYNMLLGNSPEHPRNDKLLYQLSKAYDLSGRSERRMEVLDRLVTEYPNSDHYGEAQFRRAETFFSRSEYRNAELAYSEVIFQGESHSHYQNALYMHGWSQFKLDKYRASLKSFSAVLDHNVPKDNDLAKMPAGQRELTKDTFRIMSVIFSYLDGAQTIAEVYNVFGERHYLPLLYDNLGQLYLEKERYRDSAESYRTYISRYPQSDQSPVFYGKLIDAYIAGNFSEEVLKEKENYIGFYGIHSDYWQQKSEASRDYIRPFLEKYLPELARHYHATAQALKAQRAKLLTKSAKTKQKSEIAALKNEARVSFLKAGDYYQEFIDTFPEDDQVPEMHFLLAESRFEAEKYPAAIDAYEIVAYKYPDHKRGANAGYAAIVAYGLLLENIAGGAYVDVAGRDQRVEDSQGIVRKPLTIEESVQRDVDIAEGRVPETAPELDLVELKQRNQETWLRLKISSQLRFASTFQSDKRASAVLVKSAEELLALEEYVYALAAAKQLTRKTPPAEKSLRKTAWLVIGHSEFELKNYPNAEVAYQQTLQVLDRNDPGRGAIVDRLAASVYKQGELALAKGNAEAAADQFLRVAEVAPNSDISVTAQYDAANALMSSSNWARSIGVLTAFRLANPNNPLSADIPAKLVVAYEGSGQWSKAADELTGIYQRSDDDAVKRESLYRAAELYEQAGDTEKAILRYRSYANAYADPFPIAMEARFKLSELYLQTDQGSKRRFWLKKMIVADKSAGAQRTDRSRYLAALSSSVLAEDSFQAFAAVRLKLPLKRSLKKKKSALKKTLAAYQGVAAYGVQEFTTMATYRIGSIYGQLSTDLMESERPKKLDELALEQYQILLEEQAYPFEEKAIEIHETNTQRSWSGIYDQWVKESFSALKVLLPARYGKQERGVEFASEIY